MPNLKALVERHKNAPFALIGINSGDSETAFRKGMDDFGIGWPCVFPAKDEPIKRAYRVAAFPTIYVIDPEGRVRSANARGAQLDKLVDELLEEALSGSKREE